MVASDVAEMQWREGGGREGERQVGVWLEGASSVVMRLSLIFTVSMSIPWLCYCTVVLQMLPLGEIRKRIRRISVLFLITAHKSKLSQNKKKY